MMIDRAGLIFIIAMVCAVGLAGYGLYSFVGDLASGHELLQSE